MPGLYIGLMSGTSVDGIDAALVQLSDHGVQLLATHQHPLPPALAREINALCQSGPDEIERLGAVDYGLGEEFACAALTLLEHSEYDPADIAAIGSHGQTVRHRPPSLSTTPFTLQIGDPNRIAEKTGITTVADFRRRDVAAGGEGAPLAPAFHGAVFSRAEINRAIVNIGGISNVSVLQGEELHSGFDTGPGNTLLDQWTARHQNQQYDYNGQWAAENTFDKALLTTLMEHPFLAQRGPRSTGREAFNMLWLEQQLSIHPDIPAGAVQATLAEFTAQSIHAGILSAGVAIDEVYICGGGAHNTDLMRRLYQLLTPRSLDTTAALGLDPDWVEAAAFAWLAQQTLASLPGNAPVVTGADGPRVLGAVFPAT
jgi:anhydro-N-acetylmuramic acid kinase